MLNDDALEYIYKAEEEISHMRETERIIYWHKQYRNVQEMAKHFHSIIIISCDVQRGRARSTRCGIMILHVIDWVKLE